MFTMQKLSQVAHGMEVYNSAGENIGAVYDFHLGEGTLTTTETEIETIVDTISEIFGKQAKLPMVLYRRIYDQGFVYIKNGLFRPDLIILPEQIEVINEAGVYLNVTQDKLVKV